MKPMDDAVNKTGNLLAEVNRPRDLKLLAVESLPAFCDELRKYIIQAVADNPGHLGASLGTVELTTALHYVFNTPVDKLVWDVGHQAYAHKILTGRRELFHTNRKYKGISGFPKMSESEYDAFGVGHSSTSISAVLGMAMAAGIKGETGRQFIAVIGDGALSGGMAFEALSNAGFHQANVLVILNDNNMAIDPVVHASSGQFANLFHTFNFQYTGPVDGHDVVGLVDVLHQLKKISGPKVLHIQTIKGKGFRQAELHQTDWHYTPGKFNSLTGEVFGRGASGLEPIKYQDVFGYTLLELAESNPAIVGVTPAMPTGSSFTYMQEVYPSRVFDVGIAEQHAVTFAAGLALEGLVPFCTIYSTFMQRAYDQVIHDVALQKIPVIFCLDRAGLVGADGATHHGAFDLAYFRAIPNLIISSPMDEHELRNLMYSAANQTDNPYIIRYPRGKGELKDWRNAFEEIEAGTGRMIKTGRAAAILSIGPVGNAALRAIRKYELQSGKTVALYDMRFLKPLDTNLLDEILGHHSNLITVEDGTVLGGLGTAVSEYIVDNQYHTKLIKMGIPDRFIEHGTPEELRHECGFDEEAILRQLHLLLV